MMQDFDFDEIDRAVNSTKESTPKANTAPGDTSVSVNVSRPQHTSHDSSPAVRRSSGRFMDVVHPSSDMRSKEAPTERSTPRDPEPEPEKPVDPPVTSGSDWPDPLDFQGYKEESAEAPKADEPKEEEPLKPLETPFLSGTKVEKRPLGAFSINETNEDHVAPEIDPPEAPKEEETPLLEASDEELIPAHTETEEPEKLDMPTESEPTPAPDDEPIGPTSITQQYKEQPSTTDQPSGAIFDTEAYHQPLAHPEKKRSGALIIVWILALILIGAGVGAGVYFYVLPLL